jgi:coenzyme F420 biosynthesis associated uncharacterized protein
MGPSAKRAAFYGVLVGFAAVAAAEVVRPRGGSAVLVDWRRVRAIAQQGLRSTGFETTDLVAAQADYRLLAAELERPLLELVGRLPRGAVLPDFEAVDRRGWLELNLTIIRRAVDPVVEAGHLPNSLLVQVGREGIDRYAGYTLGFLGRRVLGQYDPRLLGQHEAGEAGLYLVETNVEEWRRSADLPQKDLRRWLILHEMTHAWQFAAHPWLRTYMEQALQVVLDSVAPERSPLARAAGFAGVLPAQWRVVRQVQATMSVIEGYSNLVMNELGAKLLPGFDQLENAYRDRSSGQSVLGTLMWKLTGLELKLQQYRRGERFCRAVFDRHGMVGLNRVWEGPDSLPDLDELAKPDAWFRRVSREALPARSPR